MPDVTIVKLKIRRGTDSQRKTITLEQGELGYATDTRRVFVGDGITIGGIPVSNINHPPIRDPRNLVTQRAVVNDFIFAGTYLYQLTASDYTSLSSWTRISNNLLADDRSIGYETRDGIDYLRVKEGGIRGDMFDSSATNFQGGLSATTSGLKANVDNETLTVTTNNVLSVYNIDQRHISSTTFINGITGGSGLPVGLNIDNRYLDYYGDKLTVTAIPEKSVDFRSLDTAIFGDGLVPLNNQIVSQYVRGIGPGLTNDPFGNLLLADTLSVSDNSYFKTLEFNTKGQITSTSHTITTTLSCDSASPELALFNGDPSQVVYGVPYTNQTLITAVSSSYNTEEQIYETAQVVLSSAGFICFETTNSKENRRVGRFAIPVFSY